MLKELNPELITYIVPRGVHDLKVPKGQAPGLAQRLASTKLEPAPAASQAAQTAPAPQTAPVPAEDAAPPTANAPREDAAAPPLGDSAPAPQAASVPQTAPVPQTAQVPQTAPVRAEPAVSAEMASQAPQAPQASQASQAKPAAKAPAAAMAPQAATAPQAAPALPTASPEAKKTIVAKGQAKREWTVKGGESLSGIAHGLGVSVASLKQANGLKNDNIKPGQKLLVPLK
jgi:Meckel syndrome type 1 protein